MSDTVLKQITALSGMDIATLKATWRDLYKTEPPKFNRANIERRLAYRIQEIAYGGLPAEIKAQIIQMRRQMEAGTLRPAARHRPCAGISGHRTPRDGS